MRVKAYTKNLVIMAAVVLLSAGCGGGGSSDGAGADPGFSDNLSGVWSGSLTGAGIPTIPIVVVINQPVSGSVISVRHATVGLNGTLTAEGVAYPMSGTKDGNSVTMQVAAGTNITLTGALSSANSMNGNFTSDQNVTGTWVLTQ